MKVGDLVEITTSRVGVGVGTLGLIVDVKEALKPFSDFKESLYIVEIPNSDRKPMNYLASHIRVISSER